MNNRFRSLSTRLMIAAMLIWALAISIRPTTARASCCTYTITRSADCIPDFLDLGVEYPSHLHDFWPIGTTASDSTYSVMSCDPVIITINDACNGPRALPTTINDCIDVLVDGGCCLHICYDAACHWTITNGNACC